MTYPNYIPILLGGITIRHHKKAGGLLPTKTVTGRLRLRYGSSQGAVAQPEVDFSQQTVTYYQRVKYGIQGLTNVEYVSTNKTGLGGIIKNHGL